MSILGSIGASRWMFMVAFAVGFLVLSLVPSVPGWTWVLFGIAVAAGAIKAALDARRVFAQRKEFAAFADAHEGWEYAARTTRYLGRFHGFPFGTGTNQQQVSVLTGQLNGVDCATFTHVFEIKNSENELKQTHYFQVTLVEIPVLLPRLELVPETFGEKIFKAVGGGDLDVESYAFNKRWRVVTSDPRYAHAVLDPRMIERLMWDDTWDMAIRIDGGAVMMWQGGPHGTDDLARRLGVLTGIARRIPAHVVREYHDLGYLKDRDNFPTSPTAPDWATKGGILNSGRATGIEPGPAATGEGFHGLPRDGDSGFDIFRRF